jgi:uracil-DNA glycosylase
MPRFMRTRFDRFIAALAGAEVSERAINQYSHTAGEGRGNAIRRRNLRLYLSEMAAIGPRLLLVGEAVSHRGGRLSGIAFVSETVMLGVVDIASPPHRILGASSGYRKATPGDRLSTEASATMVWATIRQIDPLPLLWNAFPFHPFHHGQPLSNRVPSAAELAIGSRFIDMLLGLFPIERVVAVGNQAAASLTRLDIQHEKVRHPSMGGKQSFVDGMARLSHSSQP